MRRRRSARAAAAAGRPRPKPPKRWWTTIHVRFSTRYSVPRFRSVTRELYSCSAVADGAHDADAKMEEAPLPR